MWWRRLLCIVFGLLSIGMGLLFLLAPISEGWWLLVIFRAAGVCFLPPGVWLILVGVIGGKDRVKRAADTVIESV